MNKAKKYARTAAKKFIVMDRQRGCTNYDWYLVELKYIDELTPLAESQISKKVRPILIPSKIVKEYLKG